VALQGALFYQCDPWKGAGIESHACLYPVRLNLLFVLNRLQFDKTFQSYERRRHADILRNHSSCTMGLLCYR
jgi:hypothetical protein